MLKPNGNLGTTSLHATELCMRFGARLLFHIPEIHLRPQDTIYLTGKNGVGKTTLLKILAGLQKPSSGQINLRSPSFLQRLFGVSGQSGVIYLHQTPYLFDGTLWDNIAYGLKQRREHPITINQLTRQALQLIGLEPWHREHISLLSGGERQKVAMARAWVLTPSILFLDESCANLDTSAVQVQLDMVNDLRAKGTAVVISSHQENPLTQTCTQRWLIDNYKLHQQPQLNVVSEMVTHLAPEQINKDSHAIAS